MIGQMLSKLIFGRKKQKNHKTKSNLHPYYVDIHATCLTVYYDIIDMFY